LAADEGQGQGEGEGHEVVVGGKNEERDARCRLAMTEQELAAVKRHLAESRRENDDLLKAVSYLRGKLDAASATGDDTPTNLHTNDNSDATIPAADAGAIYDDDDDDDDTDEDESHDEGPLSHSSPVELDKYNSKLR